jgi:hypothetical protein
VEEKDILAILSKIFQKNNCEFSDQHQHETSDNTTYMKSGSLDDVASEWKKYQYHLKT